MGAWWLKRPLHNSSSIRSIATPPGFDANPSQFTPAFLSGCPNNSLVRTHLIILLLERGTVRVYECFAQEHNTSTPASARTQTSDAESNALAFRPPCLARIFMTCLITDQGEGVVQDPSAAWASVGEWHIRPCVNWAQCIPMPSSQKVATARGSGRHHRFSPKL